jgi:hypothetical protein
MRLMTHLALAVLTVGPSSSAMHRRPGRHLEGRVRRPQRGDRQGQLGPSLSDHQGKDHLVRQEERRKFVMTTQDQDGKPQGIEITIIEGRSKTSPPSIFNWRRRAQTCYHPRRDSDDLQRKPTPNCSCSRWGTREWIEQYSEMHKPRIAVGLSTHASGYLQINRQITQRR